jgi:hypothetical protein
MPTDSLEVHISLKKLLVGLLVTVIPITVIGIITITRTDRALETMVGTHYRAMAESTASQVAHFVHDRVIDVVALAADPAVIDAAVAANRSYAQMKPEAIEARIASIEKSWNTPSASPIVKEMLGSRTSGLLNRHRELDRRLLRITLTDEHGAAIAATHKTFDYYQADEEFWQAICANGRGAVSLTDILYDEVTKSNYIGIGVPVVEPGSNRFIGVLDALMDVTTMFPALRETQVGAMGRTMLLKEDGTVIYAPDVTLSMSVKSAELAAIRDAKPVLGGRTTGYLEASLRDRGPTLIAFADTSLKDSYPNLGWTVIVAQGTSEAFAPVRGVVRLVAFAILVGLLGVTFLGVYFALHRRQAMTEIGHVTRVAAATY